MRRRKRGSHQSRRHANAAHESPIKMVAWKSTKTIPPRYFPSTYVGRRTGFARSTWIEPDCTMEGTKPEVTTIAMMIPIQPAIAVARRTSMNVTSIFGENSRSGTLAAPKRRCMRPPGTA